MATVKNDQDYSAREAAELLGMRHLEVIRRLREGDIVGRKIGWNWAVRGSDILRAKNSDWYKNRRKN